MLMGLLLCAFSALALGPISEKTKIGLGTISGYFMTLTLALSFILFYKGNINVIQAFSILWGNIFALTVVGPRDRRCRQPLRSGYDLPLLQGDTGDPL